MNLAIKHYHSSDPKKNIKYHQKVLAAWEGSEFSNDKESFIKAFNLPIAKQNIEKIIIQLTYQKVLKFQKITQKQNIKNNNITENIKSVSNTKVNQNLFKIDDIVSNLEKNFKINKKYIYNY